MMTQEQFNAFWKRVYSLENEAREEAEKHEECSQGYHYWLNVSGSLMDMIHTVHDAALGR
jgi:ribulose 1,5-bisphosphate carboxylase large subunit-like protein